MICFLPQAKDHHTRKTEFRIVKDVDNLRANIVAGLVFANRINQMDPIADIEIAVIFPDLKIFAAISRVEPVIMLGFQNVNQISIS